MMAALEGTLPVRRIGLRLVEGIDGTLFVLTLMLTLMGLAALFSASYDNPSRMAAQAVNLGIALAVIIENGGFGARAAAPVARTVLDYFMLGKTPPGMDQPTPEDESVNEEEEGD